MDQMTPHQSSEGSESPSERSKSHLRLAALVTVVALMVGGLSGGLVVALGGSSAPQTPTPTSSSAYQYYQSMIGRYARGPMMGGQYGWMMGSTGYEWMMGGPGAPGWMRGQGLPGFMMDGASDPGTAIGRLFADAPGPRVSPGEANRLGNADPKGATVDRAANRLAFRSLSVRFTVLASPAMPDETFKVAGMINPTITVPRGARVSIELINADADMAHGLVIMAAGAGSARMPMMSGSLAFAKAAVWFLGESTSAGMHTGALTFTAATSGTYQYLCPVPGHAEKGMVGTFRVT